VPKAPAGSYQSRVRKPDDFAAFWDGVTRQASPAWPKNITRTGYRHTELPLKNCPMGRCGHRSRHIDRLLGRSIPPLTADASEQLDELTLDAQESPADL
jgi:hypothetical protein